MIHIDPRPDSFVKALQPNKVSSQTGAGSLYYQGLPRQRGFGFLPFLRAAGNFLLPIARSAIVPAVKPALKNLAAGLVDDISRGENLGRSLRSRGKAALSESAKTLLGQQKGSGRVRKGKPRRVRHSKKRNVFSR